MFNFHTVHRYPISYFRLESFAKPPDYDYCFKLIPRAGCDELKEHCFAASDDSGRQVNNTVVHVQAYPSQNLTHPYLKCLGIGESRGGEGMGVAFLSFKIQKIEKKCIESRQK